MVSFILALPFCLLAIKFTVAQQATYYGAYPINAPINVNPSYSTVKPDAVTEYQLKYHSLPPSSPPPPSQVAPSVTAELPAEVTPAEIEETPEQKEAELEAASAISPETAVELKKVIAMQQNSLTQIQAQVSELLKELKDEKKRIEEEKAHAAALGAANTLQLKIQFPETTTKEKAHQPQTKKEKETKGATATEALEVTGSIPVFVVKPDSMQDVAQMTEQVAEQAMAKDAIEAAEAKAPKKLQLKTPEEQVTEAISNIDKLEAEKAKLETEARMLRKKLRSSGIIRAPQFPISIPQYPMQPQLPVA